MAIIVERDGSVTSVFIDRPQARNAVDPETARELFDTFLAFDADDDASVAVFGSAHGAFCAGFDLKHAGSMDPDAPAFPKDIPADWKGGRGDEIPPAPMGPSRLTLSKPVIAAVAGPAVAGGMELALWCDMRVMERSAYMGVFCRRWGVPLIDGGTVRLPALVGMGRAMDLILTGRKVEAEECEKIGLCEYLVEDGEAVARAQALARDIAKFPQACLRRDRQSARAGWGAPLHEGLIEEWKSRVIVEEEGIAGAKRFSEGAGRGGSFSD